MSGCLLIFTQVEDLAGMQACNLHNLPENYTMKYCTSSSYRSCQNSQVDSTLFARSISRAIVAFALIRGRGSQWTDCRLYPGKNVRQNVLAVDALG